MNRRKFVFLSAAGFVIVTIPACNYTNSDQVDNILADPQSLSLIWDEKTILNIGNKYRSRVPKENTEQSLTEILKRELSKNNNVIENLKLKIKNDFQSHNTIMIDGWILSLTETRQCALFSIINSKN
jgi:hypothetical protein